MKGRITIITLITGLFLLTTAFAADTFTRMDEIPVPIAGYYELMSPQTSVLEGAGSWKSAQVVDVDGDGAMEIMVGTWYTSVVGGHGVWLYKEDGDSLTGAKIADLSAYMTAYGVYGGAAGDIDGDGNVDYVFGSREASPNAAIFRLEYKGSGDIMDAANYELTIIDQEFTEGGRWGVITMANVDDDDDLEVLYTSSVPAGGLFGTGPQPVVVLDLQADGSFTRLFEIDVPEADLNTGGIGSIVSNIDFDDDGKTDIYVVAHNWSDAESELTPRAYKLEYNGSEWEVVWKAEVPEIALQNTWPAVTTGDLDADGKMELIWGPVNWVSTEHPNPYRMVVFESAGDGSDAMGVAEGDAYKPNSMWTISSENDVNLRPFKWVVTDVDEDGTDEVVFSDRTGTSSGWYFGVVSTNDIPDNGDGSESWKVEANGIMVGLTGAENKWDLAVVGTDIYLFDETQCSHVRFVKGTVNEGGYGNVVTNVDVDGDGRVDVFVAGHNWNDNDAEMIPSLYKYEFNGKTWEVVWTAMYPGIVLQNTWPALTVADLDKDGKMELIHGPVNWVNTEHPNPTRLLVYESAGDGTDAMGIADENSTNYLPNSAWTIASENDVNLRPFKFVVDDVDADETDELIFADRTGSSSGWYFGVLSVDNIPDNGDGSEIWTVEANGLTVGLAGVENKWDVSVVGNDIYLYDETECSHVSFQDGSYQLMTSQPKVLEGAGSWKSSQIVDVDGDGTMEIIAGTWYTSVVGGHGVWLYKEDGDTLIGAKIADMSAYMAGYGVYGGTAGDIDGDGMVDYVFGSRDASPNAAIFRLEYQGGDMMDPNNWELSLIDSEYSEGGRWGIINLANVDDDAELEVLYTSSVPAGGLFGSGPQPIVILDMEGGIGIRPDHNAVASKFNLHQNYPNPFNPVTTIVYNVPAQQHVSLTVYNLMGREVKTLVDGVVNSGSHIVQWNGTDNFGNKVSSGMYLYTLRYNNKIVSKRMTMLK